MGKGSTGISGGVALGTRVVSGSVLRRITDNGNPIRSTSEARQARVGQLFDRGQQNQGRGVVVTVDRRGRMTVDDGRHRIIEAIKRDAKLKVTFRRGR